MAGRLLTLVRAAVGFDLDMPGATRGQKALSMVFYIPPPNTSSPFCRYKERLLLTFKLVDFDLFFCYFPHFQKGLFLNYVRRVYLCVHMCPQVEVTQGSRDFESRLELVSQAVVSCLVEAVGPELGFSAVRAVCSFNC